jgi:hypothetical protein
MSTYIREIAAIDLARNCVPWAEKYVVPAFAGDVDAALSLAVALTNAERGAVAVLMWRCRVPVGAFREFFSTVWRHDHREVIETARNPRTLAALFRYAAFTLPAELPEVVTVWRGSSGLQLSEVKSGYSWSTNRDVACWFAMRFADRNGSPLVLRADVSRPDIALFTNDRSESEAVLTRPPNARVDGDVSDWNECYRRHEKALRELQQRQH